MNGEKRILLNEGDENTLFLERADEDGFFVGELADPSKRVYVYYSERERFVKMVGLV